MGGGQSSQHSVSRDKLHNLNLGPNRVAFTRNVNNQGDSDYDDEDDSKIESVDDMASSSDEQIKDK